MNAKHSAILLSGLLLLMIGIAWAQSSTTQPPTCPPLEDESLQQMLQPEAWVKAYWDANMSRWEIDCKQIDAVANMAPANGANAMVNAARIPGRKTNSNYVNTDPYNYLRNINANANMAANAVNAANARRPRTVRREPNTRRP